MADEKALFVVISVDKPAGNAFGAIAAHLAGIGMKDIHTVDFNLNFVFFYIHNIDVRLAKNDKEIALARIFEIACHVKIGVHARFQNWNSAEFVEFG